MSVEDLNKEISGWRKRGKDIVGTSGVAIYDREKEEVSKILKFDPKAKDIALIDNKLVEFLDRFQNQLALIKIERIVTKDNQFVGHISPKYACSVIDASKDETYEWQCSDALRNASNFFRTYSLMKEHSFYYRDLNPENLMFNATDKCPESGDPKANVILIDVESIDEYEIWDENNEYFLSHRKEFNKFVVAQLISRAFPVESNITKEVIEKIKKVDKKLIKRCKPRIWSNIFPKGDPPKVECTDSLENGVGDICKYLKGVEDETQQNIIINLYQRCNS
ncbi:hypothetical protein OAB57_00150 [Bacteriovoracaceae bacterium]|nr:hypothetical protein [Bacteriovoracaceae bacterium]